jgi:hypothetical protein
MSQIGIATQNLLSLTVKWGWQTAPPQRRDSGSASVGAFRADGAGPMEIERLPLGQSRADKCRAGTLRWLNMPPGIPPEMAVDFMARIVAGETIRDLTNPVPTVDPAAPYVPPMVSADRLRKHCELNPEWGAEVRKLSWANFARKSCESSHMRRRTAAMCQKGLHPMTGDNVMISHKENRRQWRQSCPLRTELNCVKARSPRDHDPFNTCCRRWRDLRFIKAFLPR